MMTAALGISLVAFWQLLALPAADARVRRHARAVDSVDSAADARAARSARCRSRGDSASIRCPAMMLLVVTGIGTLIHVYSTAYMADEPRGGVARFFCYLNLFCFFMLMLVLGNNFLVMFVGWEGVGLCSYLLIGYWYEKKSASDAGKKAFITNRIGDWGFVLGVFLVYSVVRHVRLPRRAERRGDDAGRNGASSASLSAICLLLFVGATGKSAQIPLYVWLPDAMEGPTPVSALIHAATMVTAGVYMVGRNAVLFSHAPMVMEIVAIVGVLTALMAASIGLVQYDIKRVLAYSTVSQLGYMFTAMGVGAFSAGVFHLMTHAFFKALLFLGSGSVIHAMAGEQDMRRMGGLKKYLPVTFATMMIGTLAIAGIFPLVRILQQGRDPLPRVSEQQGDLGRRHHHGADDGVLHVPPDVDDLLRRVSRAGLGDGRSWYGGSRPVRSGAGHPHGGGAWRAASRRRAGPWARERAGSRSGARRRPSRHDAPARTRSRPVARTARVADADDVPADGARRRRDRRRIRRHPRGARRRRTRSSISSSPASRPQRVEAGATCCRGVARPSRRQRGECRRREPGTGAADESAEPELARRRARPDGVLAAHRGRRHRRSRASSTSRARRFPTTGGAAGPARTGPCRTSTTSTSCTTRP